MSVADEIRRLQGRVQMAELKGRHDRADEHREQLRRLELEYGSLDGMAERDRLGAADERPEAYLAECERLVGDAAARLAALLQTRGTPACSDLRATLERITASLVEIPPIYQRWQLLTELRYGPDQGAARYRDVATELRALGLNVIDGREER